MIEDKDTLRVSMDVFFLITIIIKLIQIINLTASNNKTRSIHLNHLVTETLGYIFYLFHNKMELLYTATDYLSQATVSYFRLLAWFA